MQFFVPVEPSIFPVQWKDIHEKQKVEQESQKKTETCIFIPEKLHSKVLLSLCMSSWQDQIVIDKLVNDRVSLAMTFLDLATGWIK